MNGATKVKIYNYIDIGNYLCACQNFSARGLRGAQSPLMQIWDLNNQRHYLAMHVGPSKNSKSHKCKKTIGKKIVSKIQFSCGGERDVSMQDFFSSNPGDKWTNFFHDTK